MSATFTMMDAVVTSLADAAQHQPGVEEPPAAILWTDAKGEWRPLIAKLRERLPEMLIYGEYDPSTRTGPAIWLRCVIDGKLPEHAIPPGKTPILYLPEVSRQDLRAGDDCPWALQPLVELQYRGVVWTQKSGRDWTVEAMLRTEEGLGLDVARDAATRRSMMASLSVLADTSLERLAGRKLEAEDFDRLMVGDHPRDLLLWMGRPEATKADMDEGTWHAFVSRCKQDYGFDPEKDGELVAGERLGGRTPASWANLWSRYAESPQSFPGVRDLLVKAKPNGAIVFDELNESWPSINEAEEKGLRNSLAGLDGVESSVAREQIVALEAKHGCRRDWVWAKLGESPLASALAHLADLAERTTNLLGGDTPDDMARRYAEGAYVVDDRAIRALASVRTSADTRAVQAAIRAVYLPWLDAAAVRLQELTAERPLPGNGSQPTVEAEAGECLLFADGLRYDLAQRLVATLEERGLTTSQTTRWSALPSVTATAKPAVAPVAPRLKGEGLPEDFAPSIASSGQHLTTPRFRKLAADCGYQVIAPGETGDPAAKDARGWCESGQIDRRGHDLGSDLAGQIESEVEQLTERISDLLSAGWRSVRVITDHGWLLMPGGLPRHDLPGYLVQSKWARCASIKGESKPDCPKAGWHWNAAAEFATAPGAACFVKGNDYAHGGVSLQECLLADVRVSPNRVAAGSAVTIESAEWFGMRLRVTVAPSDGVLEVDVRGKAASAESSFAAAVKHVTADGKGSVMVEDEELAGSAAVIVVIDAEGRVVAKRATTIGGDE